MGAAIAPGVARAFELACRLAALAPALSDGVAAGFGARARRGIVIAGFFAESAARLSDVGDGFDADADLNADAAFEAVAVFEASDDFDAVDFATCARRGPAPRLLARFAILEACVALRPRAEPALAARLSRLPVTRAFATAFLPLPAFTFASVARFDFLFLAACSSPCAPPPWNWASSRHTCLRAVAPTPG